MISIRTSVERNADVAGAYRAAIPEALLDAADAGFAESQQRVPVDTGLLLQSGVPPFIAPDGSVRWGYNAPHARPVEHGAVPHWPPIEPLKGWARRVLGDESAAYAVQRKIAERGTPPRPFVRPGIGAMNRRLRRGGIVPRVEERL